VDYLGNFFSRNSVYTGFYGNASINENIKAGSEIHAGDGGYQLSTQEKYEAFVAERNQGNKMKDFNGTELNVGDTVAFLEPHYRAMCKGVVHSFTAKKIRIEYPIDTWRDGVRGMFPEIILREPGYVAKIQSNS